MNLRLPTNLGTLVAGSLGSALWVEHSSRAAERRHHAPHDLMYLQGTRLHYRVVGQGAPVLLVHGNLVHGADWDASGLVDQLARRHQVIVIDRPGFGYSDRPRGTVWTPAEQARLLRQAITTLGIHKPVIVGHSLGTQVALCMALQDPANTAGLVLVGGYYWPSFRLDRWLAAPAAVPVLGDVLRYTSAAWTARASLGSAIRGMFHPLPVPEDFARWLPRGLLLRPLQQRSTVEDGSRMVAQARVLQEQYAALQVPITVIAGTKDKVVSPGQSVRFNQCVGGGRLHLMEGVGHMAHYTAHEQIQGGIEHALASAAQRKSLTVAAMQGETTDLTEDPAAAPVITSDLA